MAIQTQGTTGVVMEVDALSKAARMSVRPPEVLSWNSIGSQTGNLTTLAALAPIFAFRNISANPIVVRRVGMAVIIGTGFTAAQFLDYGLMIARNWTVSDSGGAAIAVTGSNAKHRTSLATPTSIDCRIATTVSLTAGSRTLDNNNISQLSGIALAGTLSAIVPNSLNNLLQHDTGEYPLVLAQNEGLLIQSITAMGAGGILKALVNMEFAEVTSY